jgi:hypothetical protein
MPVIPVNKVVDQKEKSEKWKDKEEERHKGSLTQKKQNSTRRVFLSGVGTYTKFCAYAMVGRSSVGA